MHSILTEFFQFVWQVLQVLCRYMYTKIFVCWKYVLQKQLFFVLAKELKYLNV